MTLTERIFALRSVPGFDQLRDEERLAVAASMTERRYGPGEIVVSSGSSMSHLLVVVAGQVRALNSSRTQPPVVGADLLLTNRPATETLAADAVEGALCLKMSKGYFFTVVNECPALLVEMIRLHVVPHGGELPQ